MARMHVKVPAALGDKHLTSFFERWEWRENPPDQVIIDISECEFLAPWALTLLSAYALWLWDEYDCEVVFRLDVRTRPGSYAVQAGLFELLETRRPGGYEALQDTRITPLSQITQEKNVHPFAKSVTALLNLQDEELEGAVQYSLVELLRNVVQHSKSPIGGVAMAQYFPSTGLIEVAVADCGVGVLTTLRPRYMELNTHLSSLKLSLLPHVSGTFGMGAYGSMQNNAGLGLFFIKEIATRGSGGFFLASGDSMIDLWGNADGTPGKKYLYSRKGGWRGTFAVLQLRKQRIADFDSLLRRCRELAAQARKDPALVELDFIDELPDDDNASVVVRVRSFEEDVETAATVRERDVIPLLKAGRMVVLDFSGIRFATQSFVHALMYRIVRDVPEARTHLSLANATDASKEAIKAVAAYARTRSEPFGG